MNWQPCDAARRLVATFDPITDAQAESAARILAGLTAEEKAA